MDTNVILFNFCVCTNKIKISYETLLDLFINSNWKLNFDELLDYLEYENIDKNQFYINTRNLFWKSKSEIRKKFRDSHLSQINFEIEFSDFVSKKLVINLSNSINTIKCI